MLDATVFSQSRHISFKQPVARNTVEERLKTCIAGIGRQLAADEAIPGHIKMAVSLPNEGSVLFLSQTVLNRVDVRRLPGWFHPDCQGILDMEIVVSVMIFGPSQETAANAVEASLQGVGDADGIKGNV